MRHHALGPVPEFRKGAEFGAAARPLRGHALVLGATLAVLGSCGGKGPEAPLEDTCKVRLVPRAGAPGAAAAAPPFVTPVSTIIVNAEVPLAHIKEGLEARVPKRVAEERDHDIGLAGRLEYTVDRGPFAVSVQGDALVVEAPLVAHARACAKGACYAACDPEAKVAARVPLRLGADYRFRPSSVKLDVTRGCEVRALGGIVRIDVTPVLQQRLQQEAPRIATAIDRELPDLRPEAERIWNELGKPRPLVLGACAIVAPERIAQGPAQVVRGLAPSPAAGGERARLRFAVAARPEVRVRCGAPPPPTHLPPLASDDGAPSEGDVHLAIVLSPDAASAALGGSGETLDLGRGRARVARASGTPAALRAELGGDACGDVTLHAMGAAWTDDRRAIHLAGVSLAPGEAERLSTAGLDANPLVASVERAPMLVVLSPDALKTQVPEMAGALSDERVAVSASIADARADTAGLRGDEPVAVVHLRGAITLRAK